MRRHGYSAGDRAPIGNTCPSIDSIIGVLEGVADRLEEIARRTECAVTIDDLERQAGNLRDLIIGRRSALEEIRSDNDQLRQFGNQESERADEAEVKIKALQEQISELESM